MSYASHGFDETFDAGGDARPFCSPLVERLGAIGAGELTRRQRSAELALQNMGITFNVYGHEDGTEKVWPFDVLPRILSADEWQTIEAGLKQRIRALNLFVDDIYNEQRIVEDKIVPEYLFATASTYRRQMAGFSPVNGVWCHVSGVDLVRDADGTIYVLEDNLRCPSGVSYVLGKPRGDEADFSAGL